MVSHAPDGSSSVYTVLLARDWDNHGLASPGDCHCQAIGEAGQAQPRSLPTLEGGGFQPSTTGIFGWNFVDSLDVGHHVTLSDNFLISVGPTWVADDWILTELGVFFQRFHSIAWCAVWWGTASGARRSKGSLPGMPGLKFDRLRDSCRKNLTIDGITVTNQTGNTTQISSSNDVCDSGIVRWRLSWKNARSTEVPVDGALRDAFLAPRILCRRKISITALSAVSGYLFGVIWWKVIVYGKDIKQQIPWQCTIKENIHWFLDTFPSWSPKFLLTQKKGPFGRLFRSFPVGGCRRRSDRKFLGGSIWGSEIESFCLPFESHMFSNLVKNSSMGALGSQRCWPGHGKFMKGFWLGNSAAIC